MSVISEDPGRVKIVHTYGPGLHYSESEPDVNNPQWQKRQVDDVVELRSRRKSSAMTA